MTLLLPLVPERRELLVRVLRQAGEQRLRTAQRAASLVAEDRAAGKSITGPAVKITDLLLEAAQLEDLAEQAAGLLEGGLEAEVTTVAAAPAPAPAPAGGGASADPGEALTVPLADQDPGDPDGDGPPPGARAAAAARPPARAAAAPAAPGPAARGRRGEDTAAALERSAAALEARITEERDAQEARA